MGKKDVAPREVSRILVFGLDKKGLHVPTEPVRDRRFELTFEPFSTARRFQEFDGVILFQGIFESFEVGRNVVGEEWSDHSCERDELDKRKKESTALLEKGGLICCLLCMPFIDLTEQGSFTQTDLTKWLLRPGDLFRRNYRETVTEVHCVRDEFRHFLTLFGVARSRFNNRLEGHWRPIARAGRDVVGMVVNDSTYFLPARVPDNRADAVDEYFRLLADALVTATEMFRSDLPVWAASGFRFDEEPSLEQRRQALADDVASVDASIARLQRFKRVLTSSDDALVDAVAGVLVDGFRLRVDDTDDHREDLKVLTATGDAIALVEVKGASGSVKRENVNQADNHRERANLPATFPTVLIMNTHARETSIERKDRAVPEEQVQHAARMNILVLRTLDLLRLLSLNWKGGLSTDKLAEILKGPGGWLRVQADGTWALERGGVPQA